MSEVIWAGINKDDLKLVRIFSNSIGIQWKEESPVVVFTTEWLSIIDKVADHYGYDVVKREPEIAPCPFCGYECEVERFLDGYFVICGYSCNYQSKRHDDKHEAIRLHNLISDRKEIG